MILSDAQRPSTKSTSNLHLSIDWIQKKKIQEHIFLNLIDSLKKIKSPGFDIYNMVDDNLISLVDDSLHNLEGLEPKASVKEIVHAAVKKALKFVQLPGFSPSKTLEQNVADVLVNLLPF